MKTYMKTLAVVIAVVGFTGCQPNNYDDRTDGIISEKTLTSFINDWKANRPEGATGRLVIFQAGATSNGKFLKHDDKDVVVYQIPAGGACDPSYMRHDGISNIPGAMIDGMHVDGMINMFGINPKKDYILFAVGEGSTGYVK